MYHVQSNSILILIRESMSQSAAALRLAAARRELTIAGGIEGNAFLLLLLQPTSCNVHSCGEEIVYTDEGSGQSKLYSVWVQGGSSF